MNYHHPEFVQPKNTSREFQGKKCSVWNIRIEGEDYEVAESHSHEMWANRKTGTWGRGIGNTKEDPRVVERSGTLGEIAYCKAMHDPQGVDVGFREGGDQQDFLFCGNTPLDVKTSKNRYKGSDVAWVKARGADGRVFVPRSKLYVFGYVEHEDADEDQRWAQVVLVGWATKAEVMSYDPVIARTMKSRHYNHEIPFSELHPMNELKNIQTSFQKQAV